MLLAPSPMVSNKNHVCAPMRATVYPIVAAGAVDREFGDVLGFVFKCDAFEESA